MDLTNLENIQKILQKNNLWAKKYFGQNFLIDKVILEKIIQTANIKKTDRIIEIGPGLGVLTLELTKKAKTVKSIEIDNKIIPILKENLKSAKNLEIINQDALKFRPPTTKYKVVANIPYNITSPIINMFLQAENKPETLTLLVQKEVAEKICSLDPKMTVLSLQVELFGHATLIKEVKPRSFFPPPKVDSAILQIDIYKREDTSYNDTEEALKILKTAKRAFSQRRKKLSNTLPEIKERLKELSLQDKRPETLSIKDWKKILN
jgi:16S rRNA (adenine1518-N6/adenine1519-N6)-dimethyltransferase